jgi:hypothetical protein
MAKAAFNKKRVLFTSTLELGKKLVKCYIWSIALYGAETWTLRAVDQKHLERFEITLFSSSGEIAPKHVNDVVHVTPLSRNYVIQDYIYSIYIYIYMGTAVAQWLRFCTTNRKVAGSIPADVIGFFR